MRRVVVPASLAVAAILAGGTASAGSSRPLFVVVPQTISRSISVDVGTVNLPSIGLNDAVGKSASGGTLTYATPGAADVVTVVLGDALPEGMTLTLTASSLTCDSPCVDAGTAHVIALSTAPDNLITAIDDTPQSTADLSYEVTTDAATADTGSVTVTFTITSGA